MNDYSVNEFSIYRTKDDDMWEVSFASNSKLKNRLLKLAKEYPDEVKGLIENEDGSVYAWIPISWVKINRSKRSDETQMSEEDKARKTETLRKYWEQKKLSDENSQI